MPTDWLRFAPEKSHPRKAVHGDLFRLVGLELLGPRSSLVGDFNPLNPKQKSREGWNTSPTFPNTFVNQTHVKPLVRYNLVIT